MTWRQTEDDWRRFYSSGAEQPDWVRAHGWGYSPDLAVRTLSDIRQKLAVEDHHRVLDVGCASGFVLNHVLHEQQTGVGIDYTESLLRKAATFGIDSRRIRLIAGEAAALPLADLTFDRVLCYGVFPSLPGTEYAARTIRELIRVCRPGGVILIGDVPGHVERVRGTWRRYGFGVESARAALKLPWLRPLRWATFPVRLLRTLARKLRRGPIRETGGMPDFLWYSQGFFRRTGRKWGCHVEILRQEITGRVPSLYRFDVKLTKP